MTTQEPTNPHWDNILQRLEAFEGGHKARSVCIYIDDGYGSSCWRVELHHENGRTCADEVPFLDPPSLQVAYAAPYDEDGDKDWPGLERTIVAALNAFENGLITPPGYSMFKYIASPPAREGAPNGIQ